MKIAIIIVRVLLGLLLIMTSVMYFGNLIPAQPELTGNMKEFTEGMTASGYLMALIKGTELLVGIAFVAGRFVPLAAVVLFPITINIVMVHAMLAPEGLPIALFVLFANLFLAYAYRSHYTGLLSAK